MDHSPVSVVLRRLELLAPIIGIFDLRIDSQAKAADLKTTLIGHRLKSARSDNQRLLCNTRN
ncbi:hypothetical protein FJZ31_26615 [Candidatus Poribacteria bacterium]|nr:hypothetical protein [Candidatus Poribacteria bacterium]